MRDEVAAAAAFLRDRLAEPITVADAADHVGYSLAHLARAFTREVGLAPGSYLAAYRFHTAKSLLLSHDHAVIDACTAVGYTSLPTFTRRFAASVGVTPGHIRELADTLAESEQTPFAVTPPPLIGYRPAHDPSGAGTSGSNPPMLLSRPFGSWVARSSTDRPIHRAGSSPPRQTPPEPPCN